MRAAFKELIAAVEKLKPYIYEPKMEGETEYEKAVIRLMAALVQAKKGSL